MQIQASNNSNRKTDGKRQRLSYWQVAKTVIDRHGLSGFWRGLSGSQLLVIDSSITFFAFERMRWLWLRAIKAKSLSGLMSFTLGGFSKMVAVLLTYPIRMAKESLPSQQNDSSNSLIGV